MTLRTVLALLVLATATGTFGYYLTFPSAVPDDVLPVISAEEQAQAINALKPVRGRRPLVAVLGANEGSETTDYIIPYGVLKRSGVADVVAIGVSDGPVALMPALTVLPDASLQSFDHAHPDGADYVIVPAFHDRKNAAALAWLKAQAAKGAMVVGICEGALVLAEAGLLKGKRATTHWHAIGTLLSIEPHATYVPDRRYVVDGRIVTTTGVSASLPVSLAIVEAIGGPETALRVAEAVGEPQWGVAHASRHFRLTRRDVRAVLSNVLAVWRQVDADIPVSNGVDEISLALVADAYANTFAARAFASGGAPVASANGLRFLTGPRRAGDQRVTLLPGPAIGAFNHALKDIGYQFGADTRVFVQLSLEYPATP